MGERHKAEEKTTLKYLSHPSVLETAQENSAEMQHDFHAIPFLVNPLATTETTRAWGLKSGGLLRTCEKEDGFWNRIGQETPSRYAVGLLINNPLIRLIVICRLIEVPRSRSIGDLNQFFLFWVKGKGRLEVEDAMYQKGN